MSVIKDFWERFIASVKEIWWDFEDWAQAHQVKAGITLLSLLLIVTACSASMVYAQGNIRRSQIASLVTPGIKNKKIKTLTYGEGDRQIKDTTAISVMFSVPRGQSFANVLDLLDSQQGKELNRNFYYYPLIYETENLTKQYHIDPSKVTFIFFEKGEEKNRFVFEDLANYQTELIPELNRLPMWNIKHVE